MLERIIGLYAPHRCVGCGYEKNTLLCFECRESMPRVPSRCYRCRSSTRDFAVCEGCRKASPLRHVYVATHYDGVAKALLQQAKYERAQQGMREIAEITLPLLDNQTDGVVFVPVPTATSRVRQRGYDQAVLLASYLSRCTGRPMRTMLARLGQAHQVGANRHNRIKHLEGAFRLAGRQPIPSHVLLVDDVATTGVTIETAARTLKKVGVRRVDAVVFSQPS